MKTGRLLQVALTIAVVVFVMAASASATTITFNTNAAGTIWIGGNLTLNSTSGAAGTIVFTPDANTIVGVPSNINFGNFNLDCGAGCTTQAGGVGAVFSATTFYMVVTDVTDGGANGIFKGTMTGGTVYLDVSPLTVTWTPLQLGPGASAGNWNLNFGTTYFTVPSFTAIVAPNSFGGVTTIQGMVGSTAVPEPATLSLIGSTLIGLGVLGRKRLFRK